METKDGTVKEVVINTSIGKIRIREHKQGVCVEHLEHDFTAILQNDTYKRQLRNFGTSRVILSMIQKSEETKMCPVCGSPPVQQDGNVSWCAKGHRYG